MIFWGVDVSINEYPKCTNTLKNSGFPYPRNCEECGIGPCKKKHLQEHKADQLHLTLCDALSGWKYIRETYGDLYGVGWDRVQKRLEEQITANAKRIKNDLL